MQMEAFHSCNRWSMCKVEPGEMGVRTSMSTKCGTKWGHNHCRCYLPICCHCKWLMLSYRQLAMATQRQHNCCRHRQS